MSEIKKEELIIKDEQYIAKWVMMLNSFKEIIKDKPNVDLVKNDLMELAEEAKTTFYLTPAQKSGITERCANYINGTYGKNLSTPAN